MDCKEEAKKELKAYRMKKLSLTSLKRQIRELDGRIDLATGELQESYLLRKRRMEAQLLSVKQQLANIDYCLGKLSYPEKTVLYGFFVDKRKGHLDMLGRELRLGAAGLYKLRDKALLNFATVMFGGEEM